MNIHDIPPKAGKVTVVRGKSATKLKLHQAHALKALNKKIQGRQNFGGLLVMPTGSGKTFTAAYWLLKNVINNNVKLLWIAHRHQLLDQALETFINNAYSDIIPDRTSFQYRIVSGLPDHDKPVNVEARDDLVVASKDSFQKSQFDYLLKNWIDGQDEIFLVVDEAHHATAKTYRFIIDELRRRVPNLKLLGLTATPIRTSDREQGLLKKVFPDDIIYKIDLKTLIGRGILAEPTFRDIPTNFEAAKELSDTEIEKIRQFDLPQYLTDKMAEQKERNHIIVREYFDRLSENGGYGKTIVFALDIDHAIYLDGLFKEWGKSKGIKSAFVVSGIRDFGRTISKEQNQKRIKEFREGKLQVLVNVQILTEGVDLPQAETVFLTRPTISEILMTQMIGRVLRGPEMGGTKNAFIVSFIDDWQDKISWVSPKFLYDFENDFLDETLEAARRIVSLISVAKMQEFARMLDQSIDTDALERLPAIERVPLGLYSFSLLNEKHRVVLVYSLHKKAFDAMIQDLPQLFKEADLDKNFELSDSEVDRILQIIKRRYFTEGDFLPAYYDEDIADLLRYFGEKGAEPPYLEFKDRERYDISKLAQEILTQRLDDYAERDYLNQLWDDETTFWKTFYGNNKKYFLYELRLEKDKILYPENYNLLSSPRIEGGSPPTISLISREQILARDNYHCLCCREDRKWLLQVDHIKARAHGGDDSLIDLQTLCRICNGSKGDQTINFRDNRTPLAVRPATFREFPFPRADKANDGQEWEKYLRRSINFFYQCAAIESIARSSDQSFNHWQINLHDGNDPAWLKPHLEKLVNSIHDYQVAAGIRGLQGLKITSPNKPRAAYLIAHSPKGKVTNNSTPPTRQPTSQTSPHHTSKRKALAFITDGTLCHFSYKGTEFKGEIVNGEIIIEQKGGFTTSFMRRKSRFASFSAASKTITGTQRNGWLDWQLQLSGTEEWILADDWWKTYGRG